MEKRDHNTLKEFRQFLIEEAGKLFPTYNTRTPVNRKAASKTAFDIFNLGLSIINNNVAKDMEDVYQKNKVIPEEVNDNTTVIDPTTQIADLISKVQDMLIDIENNKKRDHVN